MTSITPLERVLRCLFMASHEYNKTNTREGRLVESLVPYCVSLEPPDTIYRFLIPTSKIHPAGQEVTIFNGTFDEYYERTKDEWKRKVERWSE